MMFALTIVFAERPLMHELINRARAKERTGQFNTDCGMAVAISFHGFHDLGHWVNVAFID